MFKFNIHVYEVTEQSTSYKTVMFESSFLALHGDTPVTVSTLPFGNEYFSSNHYENTPIQIY